MKRGAARPYTFHRHIWHSDIFREATNVMNRRKRFGRLVTAIHLVALRRVDFRWS